MARSETKTLKVHPNDEQPTIDLMQRFHWSLLSSQHVKTKDSHIERRGDDLYSVTETEHYVNLVFTRDIDIANYHQICALESEYFSLKTEQSLIKIPSTSGLAVPIIVSVILSPIWGLGLLIGLFWIPATISKNNKVKLEIPVVTAKKADIAQRMKAILLESSAL